MASISRDGGDGKGSIVWNRITHDVHDVISNNGSSTVIKSVFATPDLLVNILCHLQLVDGNNFMPNVYSLALVSKDFHTATKANNNLW